MSIRCPEQNDRLADLTSDPAWIGISDSASEGDWVFLDGGSVTYTNWKTNEPNNSGGNEDCVDINLVSSEPGTWNDSNCSSSRKAIYYSTTPITGLDCMSYVDCPDTENPSQSPSVQPSSLPSLSPSITPSSIPSMQPSELPSVQPSDLPSSNVSGMLLIKPTCFCLHF